MIDLLSPYAPIYPWLQLFCGPWVAATNANPEDPEAWVNNPRPEVGDLLELRHGPTRFSALRALDSIGHGRPWALGEGWSNLTPGQAGRIVACAIRAVGPDATKPISIPPHGLLGPWIREDPDSEVREWHVGTASITGHRSCEVAKHLYRGPGWQWWLKSSIADNPVHGYEVGEAGRAACDAAAPLINVLLWEQVTPE